MDEPENHTLALLREMRAENSAWRDEVNARFDRIDKRLDAMHLNGMKALKSFIGHRSMTERAMGSIDDPFAKREARVDALEARA